MSISIPIPSDHLNFPKSIAHNFAALSNRKTGDARKPGKGQRFYVNKKGELKPLTGFFKSLYFSNAPYRHRVQKQVKQAISSLIKQMGPDIYLTSDDKVKAAFYNTFFYQRLSRLSPKVFDRTVIDQMHPDVLKIIAPDYFAAKEKIKPETMEMNEDLLTTNEDYFNYAVAVAEFAMKLGIAPEAVKEGYNGTYFVKDLKNRNVGVFKPKDEETFARRSHKLSGKVSKVAAKFVPLATAFFCSNGNAYKAEVSASIVSKELSLNNVPTTRVAKLAHPVFNYSNVEQNEPKLPLKEGSFQLFIQVPHQKANSYLKYNIFWKLYTLFRIEHTSLLKKISQLEFEKLVILDFIIGNIDRHFANWIVTTIKKKVLCFDNGFAMAHKHTDSVSSLHQYDWKVLPHAKKPFSEDAKVYINRLSAMQEDLIATLKSHDLIDANQEKTLRERIAVLIKYANEGKTPRELAKVRKTKEIVAALK